MRVLSDQSSSQATEGEKEDSTAVMAVGAGLPPIPRPLVARIESGAFIEMSELLPEHLGNFTGETSDRGKSKRHAVTDILEWVQCFGIYIAVLTRKHPERIPDLIAYQTTIIEAHLEYEGDVGLGMTGGFGREL